MKTRLLSVFTLLAFMVSGCNQEELLEKGTHSMHMSDNVEFSASFEEASAESRTYIEEDAETSRLYLRWTKGDEISIFRGTTLNQRFLFKGETGDNSGSFKLVPSDDFVSSNDLDESRNYAFYPYDENNRISEKGKLTVTLPATQTYAENSFAPGANGMVAVTESTGDVDLKFKNIGGYFKFKFYGNDLTIKSVTLKGNNGEKLAGKAGVVCQYGGVPIVTMAEEATETLTLDCGAGVKVGTTKEKATEFWFVLPPTKFTKGFTITVTDTDDGTFTKTTEKVFEIKRNTIKPISAMKVETIIFDVENEYTVEPRIAELKIEAITNIPSSLLEQIKFKYNVDWINFIRRSKNNDSGKFVFTIYMDRNYGAHDREGIVTLSCGNLYKEIKIKQKTQFIGEGGIEDMPEHEC